jgi:hypothetical protein
MVIVILIVLILIAALVALGLLLGAGSRQLRKQGYDEQPQSPGGAPRT